MQIYQCVELEGRDYSAHLVGDNPEQWVVFIEVCYEREWDRHLMRYARRLKPGTKRFNQIVGLAKAKM